MSTKTIFRKSVANKRGLSLALDSTLKTSHDMKVFGVGALAEFASVGQYRHFALQRFHFYKAMEERFETTDGAITPIWKQFGSDLQQTSCLRDDLRVIGLSQPDLLEATAATNAYCDAIKRADGDKLVAHFYCRYFADLFGGSMLAKPTSLALDIPPPSFYSFPIVVERDRAAYIESIYEQINRSGESMSDDAVRNAVVEESKAAFHHNAAIIREQGMNVVLSASVGLGRVMLGFAKHYAFQGSKKKAASS